MAPESKKLLIAEMKALHGRPSGRPSGRPPARKQHVMFHETDDVSNDEGFLDVEHFEVYDDDSPRSLIAAMHEMLENVTKGPKQSGQKRSN